MTVEDLLQALDRKDNTEAYQALLELERLSSDSNVLYPYTEKFAEMTESDRNVVRVRGVRLFCSQAKWDSGSMIDRFLDQVLAVLQDDRPTTVRQTLAALQDVHPLAACGMHAGDARPAARDCSGQHISLPGRFRTINCEFLSSGCI